MIMIPRKELLTHIGGNVRRLRESRGWSQGQLAERLGISRITANRIERSLQLPEADILYALADLFGVPADSLRQVSQSVVG
jgi:transcriptional regulator with XRE-family HTH domain